MLSGYQGTFQGPPRRREVALMRWQVRAAERWKGTELYFPFYKTICWAPCISPGPVSAEQRTARCDTSAAVRPFPAPWGERDRVPALAGTDGVPEGFAPLTPAGRPRGGCGLRRGRRGDDALLNKAGSFGGAAPPARGSSGWGRRCFWVSTNDFLRRPRCQRCPFICFIPHALVQRGDARAMVCI